MAQLPDHATSQLYEKYHTQVYAHRDTRTYDHFASGHSRTLRQAELLPGYFQELINAILSDLHTMGDCWLLRAVVNHELPAIHLLDHSAIAYVYTSLFSPEELPRLDTRSIPYSSSYSTSAGGMLYADRRARSCVIDLRCDEVLHPLCHALRMYASRKTLQDEIDRLNKENNALHSQITQLNDRILGLEFDCAARRIAENSAIDNEAL